LNGGHRTLPPNRKRGGRKAEAQRVRGSGRNEDPHCEATRGVGPVTGAAGSENRLGRGGRHRFLLKPRASWCSYHREALTLASAVSSTCSRWGRGPRLHGLPRGHGPGTPAVRQRQNGDPRARPVLIPPGGPQPTPMSTGLPVGIGAGSERGSTPRLRLWRRPGDGGGGIGAKVRSRWASPFPPQSRGPLDAHTIKRPSPFVLPCCAPTVPVSGRTRQVERENAAHCSRG